jgi:hypothetical protein
MPQMNGDLLADKMRKAEPDLKVLYLTGFSDELFKDKGALWKDEAFPDKPCSVKGLLEAVSLMLYGRLGPAPLRELCDRHRAPLIQRQGRGASGLRAPSMPARRSMWQCQSMQSSRKEPLMSHEIKRLLLAEDNAHDLALTLAALGGDPSIWQDG